jgi:hypothetical protein
MPLFYVPSVFGDDPRINTQLLIRHPVPIGMGSLKAHSCLDFIARQVSCPTSEFLLLGLTFPNAVNLLSLVLFSGNVG